MQMALVVIVVGVKPYIYGRETRSSDGMTMCTNKRSENDEHFILRFFFALRLSDYSSFSSGVFNIYLFSFPKFCTLSSPSILHFRLSRRYHMVVVVVASSSSSSSFRLSRP